MDKDFIKYETIRDNAIRMAHTIYNDGFVPDVIYVSLRGGAYLGNIISEYFKIRSVHLNSKPVLYAAVVARSYTRPTGGGARGGRVQVVLDGWTYDPKYLRVGDKVLLIDDIFDTGNTINYLAQIILDNGVGASDLRIAVHDYKERKDSQMTIRPHYYSRKQVVGAGESSPWLHYLSHEMVGLTDEEISKYYSKEIAAILQDQDTPPSTGPQGSDKN